MAIVPGGDAVVQGIFSQFKRFQDTAYSRNLIYHLGRIVNFMAMIHYTTGNLLASGAEALVNTVNTVGVMGKGIALQFKQAFPHNYEVYKQACLNGTFKTGQILPVKDHDLLSGERLILNFPTKQHWKMPSQYAYIESGLIALADYLKQSPVQSLAMPALGCGNGGLDWANVKPMIVHHLGGLDKTISIYEPG